MQTSDLINIPDDFPNNEAISWNDLKGNTIGFTVSAGIRYQIIPLLGVGISGNGIFGSLSKMKSYNHSTGKDEKGSISRKINRLGISAAIDFSF